MLIITVLAIPSFDAHQASISDYLDELAEEIGTLYFVT
jgi:hypothetical protein